MSGVLKITSKPTLYDPIYCMLFSMINSFIGLTSRVCLNVDNCSTGPIDLRFTCREVFGGLNQMLESCTIQYAVFIKLQP